MKSINTILATMTLLAAVGCKKKMSYLDNVPKYKNSKNEDRTAFDGVPGLQMNVKSSDVMPAIRYYDSLLSKKLILKSIDTVTLSACLNSNAAHCQGEVIWRITKEDKKIIHLMVVGAPNSPGVSLSFSEFSN